MRPLYLCAMVLALYGCSDRTTGVVDSGPGDTTAADHAALDYPAADVSPDLSPDVTPDVAPDITPDLPPADQSPDLPLPTCTDGIKNGDETDIDCGGATCVKCTGTKKCKMGTDCKSGVCAAGVCAEATCSDGVKNGDESDTDCGGSTCVKCASAKQCKLATDCASGVCTAGICAAATCTDGVKNGDETDTDCGGSTCVQCASAKQCKLASDCASGVCTAGICVAATCTDGAKNGDETDIDCGGASCTQCADTKTCKLATDCISGVCSAGVCLAATCTDKIKNGKETDTDCGGGTCSGCVDGKSCSAGTDCVSGSCTGGKCVTPTYTSCKTLLATIPGTKSGLYLLDPDGKGGVVPFKAWCDMTTSGGGWTLVTNRKKGTVTKHTSLPLTPKEAALAVTNARWAALRAVSTHTIATFGSTVYTAQLSVLASANCNPLAKDLTANQLAHHETSGCTETGVDYSCWFGAETHGPGGTTYFSDCSNKTFFIGGCAFANPAAASMYVR